METGNPGIRHGSAKAARILGCLRAVVDVMHSDLQVDERLQRVAETVPSAWEHPNAACARIVLEGRAFQSKDFAATQWRHSAAITVRGRQAGSVEVCCREPQPGRAGDSLATEERALLDIIAAGIGSQVERAGVTEELRDSNQRYTTIAELIPLGTWTSGPDGAPVYLGNSFLDMAGMAADELCTGGWARLLSPEDMECFRRKWELTSSTGGAWSHEYEIRAKDGRRRSILAKGMPLRDAQGRITSWVGINLDITDRKQTERALESFTDTLMETAQSIVVVVDAHCRVQRFNTFAQQLSGRPLEEVRGRDWVPLFVPPEEQGRVRELFAQVFAGTPMHGLESRILHKDGRELRVNWYVSPIHGADGAVCGVLGIGHDVTDIRQKEEQLRHAARMEAVGRLAGGVAHDFNNYLTTIIGYSHIVLQDLPPEDPMRPFIDEIAKAAGRAAQLTKQLLTFSRKAIIHPQVIDLNGIIADMRSPLKMMVGDDIHLSLQLATGLGQIKADAGQIRQIVMNLVANARDAMPGGGRLTIETANVKLESELAAAYHPIPPGAYAALTVADTGAGMDDQMLGQLFEPFFTTKPVGQGTGLGLATVHGIVNQSGGHIAVSSRLGLGATFSIYFPHASERGQPEQAVRPPAAAEGNETILVVEDEPAVRHYLMRALSMFGYKVLKTGSPLSAVSMLHEDPEPIHLLLTDVIMPEMNGPQLASKLKAIRPEMRVLFISGYTRDALAQRGIMENGVHLLTKPFTPDELVKKIRQVLTAAG